jgi:macrolide-specific efflux system membrane fusion protein
LIAPGSEPPIGEDESGIDGRIPKLFLAVVVVVLILVAIVAAPHLLGGSGSGKSRPQLATVSRRTFPVTVVATGVVVPIAETAVNFTTAGTLAQIDVSTGEAVSSGTVLAHLDSAAAQSEVTSATAALAAAQAQLKAADSPGSNPSSSLLQSNVTTAIQNQEAVSSSVSTTNGSDSAIVAQDRQQLATDQGRYAADGCSSATPPNAGVCTADQTAVTTDQSHLQADLSRQQSDLSSGQARLSQAAGQVTSAKTALAAANTPDPSTVASAQASVASATAALQRAQAALNATTLTSPITGTVLAINGQVGQTVAGAQAGNAATLPGTTSPVPQALSASTATTELPFMVVGDPSSLAVGAVASSSEVQELSDGQAATISDTSTSGLDVPGRVLAVGQATSLVNGAPQFFFTVTPTGSSGGLRSGMSVTVTVDVSRAVGVLAVPSSAVFTIGGVPHVDVWNGKKPVSTAVTTGLQGSTLVQITSGVTFGQQVVLAAYQGLATATASASGSS